MNDTEYQITIHIHARKTELSIYQDELLKESYNINRGFLYIVSDIAVYWSMTREQAQQVLDNYVDLASFINNPKLENISYKIKAQGININLSLNDLYKVVNARLDEIFTELRAYLNNDTSCKKHHLEIRYKSQPIKGLKEWLESYLKVPIYTIKDNLHNDQINTIVRISKHLLYSELSTNMNDLDTILHQDSTIPANKTLILWADSKTKNQVLKSSNSKALKLLFSNCYHLHLDNLNKYYQLASNNKQLDIRHLVITVLPFYRQYTPEELTILKSIEESGNNPFMQYAIPRALKRFKQCIELIDEIDIITILDSRIVNRNYGCKFLEILPNNHQIMIIPS